MDNIRLAQDIWECYKVGGKGWGSEDVERWRDNAVLLEIENASLQQRVEVLTKEKNTFVAQTQEYLSARNLWIDFLVTYAVAKEGSE